MTWTKLFALIASWFRRDEVPVIPPAVTPYSPPIPVKVPTPSELLGKVALNCLGLDVTPKDTVPDDVACAEVVSTILRKAGIDIPVIPSTTNLYLELKRRQDFEMVSIPEFGVVIISPSAYGNGTLEHGHTGIYLSNWDIGSNNSATGKFEENYNTLSWKNRYGLIGKFPIVLFKYKGRK